MRHPRSKVILTVVGTLLVLLLPLSRAGAEPKNDLAFSVGANLGITDDTRGALRAVNGTPLPTKKGDLWFGGSLGAEYSRRLTFGDLSLSAGGSGAVYTSDKRWNQVFGHGTASLRVPLTSRLIWSISDRFTPAPISFSDIDTARSNQTQFNKAATKLEFTVPFRGRWSSRLSGSFAREDVIDIDKLFAGLDPDRYAINGKLSLERQFGTRWSFGLSGYIGHTIFINNAPAFVDTTGFGGSVEGSYSVQKNTRFFGSIGIGRLISQRNPVTFLSIGSNNLIWSVGVDWRIFKRLGLRVEGRRAHTVLLTGANAVVSSISAELDYTMSSRVSATLKGVWQHTDGVSGSVAVPGADQVIHVSPALTYRLGKNYKASLTYAFTRNGGDDSTGNDFNRNTGIFGLSAEF